MHIVIKYSSVFKTDIFEDLNMIGMIALVLAILAWPLMLMSLFSLMIREGAKRTLKGKRA